MSNFRGPDGCARPTSVIIKSWVSLYDRECVTEAGMYRVLTYPQPVLGIPDVRGRGWNARCEVYAIVMQKLGS